MNILSHCISQVLHGKQMAYSNSDYLRRFYLQRYYFQRCGQSGGKPTGCAATPNQEQHGCYHTQGRVGGKPKEPLWVPRRKGGSSGMGSVTSSPHEGTKTKKCLDCTQLPPSNLRPKLPISRSQTKIQGQRSQECSSYLSASWEKSRWTW